MDQKTALKALKSTDKLFAKHEEMGRMLHDMRVSVMMSSLKGTAVGEINFTTELFFRLMRKYHDAIEKGQDSFEFEKQEILTSYAKYLLQYLEPKVASDSLHQVRINRYRREHAIRMKAKG